MGARNINHEAQALALGALAWTLADPVRAERLLAMTGLAPDHLRRGAGTAPVQAAVIAFLENHEPDLIACATAVGCTPGAITAARAALDVA